MAHSCQNNSKLLTAQRIDQNDNKNLTSKSNSPQHKQDAHSTNENFHSTNENSHSTTKSRRLIVPFSRFEEIGLGNHLPVVGAKVLDFLTRVYSVFLEKFTIRGRGKIEWMHSIKYLFGILIFHFIHITMTRSHVEKYKAIQHTLVTI